MYLSTDDQLGDLGFSIKKLRRKIKKVGRKVSKTVARPIRSIVKQPMKLTRSVPVIVKGPKQFRPVFKLATKLAKKTSLPVHVTRAVVAPKKTMAKVAPVVRKTTLPGMVSHTAFRHRRRIAPVIRKTVLPFTATKAVITAKKKAAPVVKKIAPTVLPMVATKATVTTAKKAAPVVKAVAPTAILPMTTGAEILTRQVSTVTTPARAPVSAPVYKQAPPSEAPKKGVDWGKLALPAAAIAALIALQG